MSGAVIERIRLTGFLVLATILGSVVWIIGAAWGWHPAGWMLTELGFHDVGAAGCVHLVAGAFALGVLINLGPRIGRFGPGGRSFSIRGYNLPMSMLALMLIYVGFFGFLMGCVIYSGDGFLNIYGAPTNLSP
jgi:ammonium transporter, Amt family